MFRFVVASCLAAAACGQFLDPKNAKILKEQRFNAGDGRFGSAFAQEDGSVFREETTADGERIGQYSYIDNDGKTITVRYTAGKDGFRILEGDHIPEGANGLNSAPFDPNFANAEPQQVAAEAPRAPQAPLRRQQARPAPVPRQQPQPQPIRQQPVQRQQQFAAPVQQALDNPFINPADPTHLNFQVNTNAAQFTPQQPQQQRAQPQFVRQQQPQQFARPAAQAPQTVPNPNAVPACADCAGVNPFINPADSSHAQLFTQARVPQQAAAPAFRQPAQSSFTPASTFVPQQQPQQTFVPQQTFQQNFQQPQQTFVPQQTFQAQQTFQQQPQQQAIQPAFLQQPAQQQPAFRQSRQQVQVPAQPQGQLNLNRFETGFNFDFSS